MSFTSPSADGRSSLIRMELPPPHLTSYATPAPETLYPHYLADIKIRAGSWGDGDTKGMETVPGRTERVRGSSKDRKVSTQNRETNAEPMSSVMFSCLLL